MNLMPRTAPAPRASHLWTLALALTLAGCATPPPSRTADVPSPVAATWTTAPEAAQAPTQNYVWLDDFGSDALAQAVTQALEHNFDLRAAAARLDAQLALTTALEAGRYPQVGFGSNAARRRGAARVTTLPGQTTVVNSTTNNFGLSLDISWELDVWGRLADSRSADLAKAQAATADFAAARLSLAGQTARQWMLVTALQQQQVLAQDTLDSYHRTENTIRERYHNGLSDALNLRLARTQTAQAEASLHLFAAETDAARRTLEILMGRYPASELTTTSELPELHTPVPAGLPSELLERRPDLIAAERRLAASDPRIRAAKKAFLPTIALTGSAGQSSDRLEEVLDNAWSVWSLAANLVQPVFQGRRLSANLEQARAEAEAALANYGQAALTAFAEVEIALRAEQLWLERLAALEQAETEARAAEELAWQRYQRGLVDITTVLDTQRQVFNLRSALIDATQQRLINRINLHLALGG